MKKLLAVVAQFFLFLICDGIGNLFYHPFRVRTTLAGNPAEPRMYIWDGLILMFLVYVLLLVIAALRRKIGASAPWATLALMLAVAAGYGLRLGFVTQNW